MSRLKKNMISPADYTHASVLAREVTNEMLARLDFMTIKPKRILNAAGRVSEMSWQLQSRYPEAQLVAIDDSLPLLHHAAEVNNGLSSITYLCGSATSLPFADHSVDLVMANLLFPYHTDYSLLLREWRRILSADGLLMMTAFGLDTLKEWPSIFQYTNASHDNRRDSPQLVDIHDIGDLLLAEGFVDPVLDVDHYTMLYRTQAQLRQEVYQSGMAFFPMEQEITDMIGAADGSWPLTYEVIYAHAFAPEKLEAVATSLGGMTRIPLSQVRRQLKREEDS